ncbi:MAG TPA: phosphatidylglycerophosphatase A, partial [candidate division Zixibacteria bacterium]|nr:phosphatidylglycerophosphatase A [candidate division Zixibacteria bacterium]
MQSLIATLGVTGFLPFAPGTFGTLLSFLLIIFFKPGDTVLLVILVPLFILGITASNHAEKILGKDSGHIVIDEFYGYLISVLFIPKSIGYLLAAFILFRIFDIFKPPPIRRIEEIVPGGVGVMLD